MRQTSLTSPKSPVRRWRIGQVILLVLHISFLIWIKLLNRDTAWQLLTMIDSLNYGMKLMLEKQVLFNGVIQQKNGFQ